MAEFTLEHEESVDISPGQSRLVSGGLAPTADIPTTRTKERPPCYVPCPECGQEVLRGKTAQGLSVALDVSQETWIVLWDAGAATPRLVRGQGYPVHQCRRSNGG